ncbi:hypothetical protein LWI28_004585 [Acer negundo]|uniref:PROP1-like PPR domain-containing protein n=1 Tax=Acer negundo TaxID=4023 RepID=A0AAD5IQS8_ACENE|nr:hypothetical protein LWI28_004585 [Acer negundo]
MGSWLTIGSWVVRRYRHKVVVRLSWVWNHDVDRELHFGNDLALWLQDYMGSVRVPICALGIFTANGFSVHGWFAGDPWLKVSSETGREERVYEYLQKLRNSMRCVSDEKVKAIEDWFCREKATGVKRVSFDEGSVKEVVLKNGGGWHGLRWIGTSIGFQREGVWIRMENAAFCGHELVSVDINDAETEKFARSIAGLAMEKKVKANFSEFQVSGFVSPWISSI